jgi:ribonuclease T1
MIAVRALSHPVRHAALPRFGPRCVREATRVLSSTVTQSLVAVIACALFAAVALARGPAALVDVQARALPTEAREMLALIHAGGPFRYGRDGVVFGNRERLLPPEPRGYYHEYTVGTPGARNRGARRIVCGGAARKPVECFYTDDHYASFRRIRE